MVNMDTNSNADLVAEREYAKVLRELIQRENDMTNHRLTWLLVSQGILFTATANFMKPGMGTFAAKVLICIGIAVSFSFFCALMNSAQARKNLRAMWTERIKGRGRLVRSVPPIDGATPYPWRFLEIFTPWIFVPGVIVLAWILLLLSVCFRGGVPLWMTV